MSSWINITGSQIEWDTTYFGGGASTSGGTWSRGSSGYVKLEGGLIIQHGPANIGGSTGRYDNYVYFPIRFPNAVISLAIGEAGAGGWGTLGSTTYTATTTDLSYFCVQAAWATATSTYYTPSLGGCYIAVGY